MIPNIFHFCGGLMHNFGGTPFSLIHHLSIASAIYHNKPAVTYFWYEHEPTGIFWELTKPLVKPMKIVAPTHIFDRPLLHPAHRADIVRLQKLLEYGGIYSDWDVIHVKPFTPLLDNTFVMGMQGKTRGLCNAILLSAPSAPFPTAWLQKYKTFRSKGRDAYWDQHSVWLPMKMAKDMRDDITIMPSTAFFYPLWDGIPTLVTEDTNFSENSYCVHLWQTLCWHLLKDLTVEGLKNSKSELARLVAPFLPKEVDDVK